MRKIVWVPRVHQLWMLGRAEVLLRVAEMWSFPILLFLVLAVLFLLFFLEYLQSLCSSVTELQLAGVSLLV